MESSPTSSFTNTQGFSFWSCWLWILPCIKFSWLICAMWNKFKRLNWLELFLCEELSFINLKGFCYLYTWSSSLCKGRASFLAWLFSEKLGWLLFYFFNWLYLFHLFSVFYISNHPLPYAQLLILFSQI